MSINFTAFTHTGCALCEIVQVSPEVITKKGLLPMIEINLDLVDSEVRFQPQVSFHAIVVGIAVREPCDVTTVAPPHPEVFHAKDSCHTVVPAKFKYCDECVSF